MVDLPDKARRPRQSHDEGEQRIGRRDGFSDEGDSIRAGSQRGTNSARHLGIVCPDGISPMTWTVTWAKFMPWLCGLLCLAEIAGHLAASSRIQAIAAGCVALIGCDCLLMILGIVRAQMTVDAQERGAGQAKLYRQKVGPLLICALVAGTDIILRLHQTSNAFVVMGISLILAGIAMAAARLRRDPSDDQDHRATRPPIGVY